MISCNADMGDWFLLDALKLETRLGAMITGKTEEKNKRKILHTENRTRNSKQTHRHTHAGREN